MYSSIWLILLAVYYTIAISIIWKQQKKPNSLVQFYIPILLIPFLWILIWILLGNDRSWTRVDHKNDYFERYKEKFVSWWDKHSIKWAFDSLRNAKAYLVNSNESYPLIVQSVRYLYNGESMFPTLVELIQLAKNHLHMEFFDIGVDESTKAILNEIGNAVNRGVTVRVLIDDIGSEDASASKKVLEQLWAEVVIFSPARFMRLRKINFRDHRKIVVVDWTSAIIWWINLSKVYDNAANAVYRRDSACLVTWDRVRLAQAEFMSMWSFVTGTHIWYTDELFPVQPTNKSETYWMFVSSMPLSGAPHVMNTILCAFESACKRLDIVTPYFSPSREFLKSLEIASHRGVCVRLIVPQTPDYKATEYMNRSFYAMLLAMGVEVYEYTKGVIHSKIIIVDNHITMMGSANFNVRSFYLNAECMGLFDSESFTTEMRGVFENDLADCERVTQEYIDSWSLPNRMLQWASRALRPIL